MAFNQLLHPELILDLRGDKMTRELYSAHLNRVDFNPSSGGLEVGRDLLEISRMDKEYVRHIAICKKFKNEKGKTFHIGRDFLTALASIDRDIPIEYLPAHFIGYISFAPETLYDEESWVQGAYVYIGGANETGLPKEDHHHRVAWICYLNKPFGKEMGDTCPATNLMVHLDEPSKVFDLLKSVPSKDSPFYSSFVESLGLTHDEVLKKTSRSISSGF